MAWPAIRAGHIYTPQWCGKQACVDRRKGEVRDTVLAGSGSSNVEVSDTAALQLAYPFDPLPVRRSPVERVRLTQDRGVSDMELLYTSLLSSLGYAGYLIGMYLHVDIDKVATPLLRHLDLIDEKLRLQKPTSSFLSFSSFVTTYNTIACRNGKSMLESVYCISLSS